MNNIWPFLWQLVKLGIGAVAVLLFMMTAVLYIVLKLRWVIGKIQSRIGPNRTGGNGWAQTIADALKLFQKEDIIPKGADRWLFTVAPAMVFVPVYLVYAVIPFGDGLTASKMNVGVVYLGAVSCMAVIGIVIGGWASNNRWSLLGAFRAASQLIAYEIPVALSLCVPVMIAGSLDLTEIVGLQGGGIQNWIIFKAWPMIPAAFLMLFIAELAEINVAPFDITEAESELVAGFNTEYSGMKFALFFLAEFAESFTLAAILVTLFFGGPSAPLPILGDTLTGAWGSIVSLLWFIFKSWLLVLVILWIRSTLPRVRMDKLMNLCWKCLIPTGLANIMLTALYIVFWVNK